MRILLIANKIPYPPKDGGSIATLNMAMGLSEQGAKVTLLAMNTSKHFFFAQTDTTRNCPQHKPSISIC